MQVYRIQASNIASPPAVLSGSSTNITVDASISHLFKINMGSNHQLSNPINITEGVTLSFIITQDITGNRALTFDTAFLFPANTSTTLSTTGNSIDIITGYYNGTSLLCTLQKGFVIPSAYVPGMLDFSNLNNSALVAATL